MLIRYYIFFVPILFSALPVITASSDLFEDSGQAIDGQSSIPSKDYRIQIVQYPRKQNLIGIPISGPYSWQLSVDKSSVSLTDDGIILLAYEVKSKSGVSNVFYEGIHCPSQNYKTYAVGGADDTFIKTSRGQWQKLPYFEDNTGRYTLSTQLLCSKTRITHKPKEIVDQLTRYAH